MTDQKTFKMSCKFCQRENTRSLPYDMAGPDSCDHCGQSWRNVRPDKRLELLGDLFRDRNTSYGDSFTRFGPVMEAMFPQGLVLRSARDWNRAAVFLYIIGKVHRYAIRFHDGGHADSLDDISVYAQMLRYIDEEKGGE
jgi:hypothetical protein